MRIIYLSFLLFLINFIGFSQSEPPCLYDQGNNWSYNLTANNATIAIQQDNFDNMEISCNNSGAVQGFVMSSINCPIWLGVFYTDDNGDLQCGGYTEWNSTQSFALAAWGDDPTTPEKDGFAYQEPYAFQLCVDSSLWNNFDTSVEMSSDSPFSETYATNGFGNITSMSSYISGSCESICINTIDINEYSEYKKLVKTVDLYGREVNADKNSGFMIQIYSNIMMKVRS